MQKEQPFSCVLHDKCYKYKYIIETKFGTLVNTKKVAAGSASSIKKTGAFYNFSIRITNDDIREYSFTDLARAQYMRTIMIGHLEEKIKKDSKNIFRTA
jgi:hypothetical protein